LQNRLEEETIVRSDLESQITCLKQEIDKLKDEIKSNTELSSKSNSQQVEALIEKLKASENQRENDIFALQEDLVRKEESVFQLEASMERRNSEIANLQSRVLEFEQELDLAKQRNDRHLEAIDELNLRIKKEESNKRLLSEENNRLKQQLKESEKRLLILEERICEISSGKKEVEFVASRVKDLEKELEVKDSIEKTLEDSLLETKSKYEKFEGKKCFNFLILSFGLKLIRFYYFKLKSIHWPNS
jgi:chromosome segregation ATPase